MFVIWFLTGRKVLLKLPAGEIIMSKISIALNKSAEDLGGAHGVNGDHFWNLHEIPKNEKEDGMKKAGVPRASV